jgi:hypothetical protein
MTRSTARRPAFGLALALLAAPPGCGTREELPRVPDYTPSATTPAAEAPSTPAPAASPAGSDAMIPGSPPGVNVME